MKPGQIVTLDDNEKYLLLMDSVQEGHKFFYANKLTNDEKTTSEYELFEETKEGDDIYLSIIDDDEIREFLITVFTSDLLDTALDIESGKTTLEEINEKN